METSISQIKEQILTARQNDLEEEKHLCLSLLDHNDADYHTYAFAYTFLADYYMAKQDTENTSYYLYMAKSLSEKNNYEDLLIRIYHYYGMNYLNYSDYQTSVDYYFKALTLAKKTNNILFIAAIYNNIANIFENAADLEESLVYYKKSFETLQGQDSLHYTSIAITLTNLCNISYQCNKHEELITYFNKFKEIPESEFNENMIFLYHFNKFLYLSSTHQNIEALNEADKLMDLQDMMEDRLTVYQVFVYMGDILIKINEKARAKHILEIIEHSDCASEAMNTLKIIEMKIRFCEQFNLEYELNKAYKEYYLANLASVNIIKKNSSDGLKAKISLHKSNDERRQIQYQNKQLEQMMNIDELTNLLNRRFFDHYLIRQCKENKNHPLGIAMIDIDCFKEYNDFYGHIEGDKILYEVGDTLSKFKHDNFHICRFGGDEFACIFENCTSKEIEEYLSQVYNDLEHKKLEHSKSSVSPFVTISTGFIMCNECLDIEYLVRCADKELYNAKRRGRNCWSKSPQSI